MEAIFLTEIWWSAHNVLASVMTSPTSFCFGPARWGMRCRFASFSASSSVGAGLPPCQKARLITGRSPRCFATHPSGAAVEHAWLQNRRNLSCPLARLIRTETSHPGLSQSRSVNFCRSRTTFVIGPAPSELPGTETCPYTRWSRTCGASAPSGYRAPSTRTSDWRRTAIHTVPVGLRASSAPSAPTLPFNERAVRTQV